MVDHEGEPLGPAGMAQADLDEAERQQQAATIHGNVEAALREQAQALSAAGMTAASGPLTDAAAHEGAVKETHEAIGNLYTEAGSEWTAVDHELREAGQLSGEAYVAHDRERSASDKLAHPEHLTDEQRTALELEAARERATAPVLEHRATEIDAEAAHHAERATNIEANAREYEEIARKRGGL